MDAGPELPDVNVPTVEKAYRRLPNPAELSLFRMPGA
jgi:hypothetical protein